MSLSEHDQDPETDWEHNQLRFWLVFSGHSLQNLFSCAGNVLRFVWANLTELDESEVEWF